MRILMLGNSFTYYHDMPKILAQMLDAEVVAHTRGGARLAEQLNLAPVVCGHVPVVIFGFLFPDPVVQVAGVINQGVLIFDEEGNAQIGGPEGGQFQLLTLPELIDQTAIYEAKVKSHLERMGFQW